MSNLLSEPLKIDIGLTSSNLNGAGTGPYYPLDLTDRALFVVEIGAMAAAATSVLQVMQATNAAGGGAATITNAAATITANTAVASATLTLVGVQVADAVTINGLTYTAAAAPVLASRIYDQSGNDAADAASLVLAINHATAGVPGVTATDLGGGAIQLDSTVPGETTITITAPAATITPATLRAVGYVEVQGAFLNAALGMDHIALRVTNSAAMLTGAVLLRGDARYTPTQAVAASKVDVSV